MSRIVFDLNYDGKSISANEYISIIQDMELVSQTSSVLHLSSPDGYSMSLTGNLSGGSQSWRFSSIVVYDGNHVLTGYYDIDLSYSDYVRGSILSSILQGDDTIESDVTVGDRWDGYSGDDYIDVGTGNDYVSGGSGTDTLRLAGDLSDARFSRYYTSTIVTSDSGRDTVTGIEYLEFDDVTVELHSNAGSFASEQSAEHSRDLVFGNSSSNTLRTLAGADTINGGDGNDRIYSGSGHDQIDGGDGNDRIYSASGHDEIDGGGGNDRIFSGRGRDQVDGGNGNDTIFGGKQNDALSGGAGKDRLVGGFGSDTLMGQSGNDVLIGGGGKDVLEGGSGNDRLRGGGGSDTFVFGTSDGRNRIIDFSVGEDHIEFNGTLSYEDLSFTQRGDDVVITLDDSALFIRVKDMDINDIQDADNFLF